MGVLGGYFYWKVVLEIWFGHQKYHFWYPQNAQNRSLPNCLILTLGAKLSGAKLPGALLSVFNCWCQIVRFYSRCQIVRFWLLVPNYPVLNCLVPNCPTIYHRSAVLWRRWIQRHSLTHSLTHNITTWVGWFLFRKFYFFNFYMVSSCSIWSPIFKTVFVFDVRPFLLLSVKFFGFNGNFNGKMTKINKMAKNHFSRVQNGSQSV